MALPTVRQSGPCYSHCIQPDLMEQKRLLNERVEKFCEENSLIGEELSVFKARAKGILGGVAGIRFPSKTWDYQEEKMMERFLVASQGLLLSAVYSDVDPEAKVQYLRTHEGIHVSPDDAVAYRCLALIAIAKKTQAAAEEAQATADAAVDETGAAAASADGQAVATAPDPTVSSTKSAAHGAKLRAGQCTALGRYRYDLSALHAILMRGSREQLHILFRQGLILDHSTASRAMRDIIQCDLLEAEAAEELFRDVLENDFADVNVRYVDPIDDLTVVGAAVEGGRVRFVGRLLYLDPGAVNVAGARLGFTPAHCAPGGLEPPQCVPVEVPCARACEKRNCHNSMNRELFRRGADPTRRDWEGNTPSLCAYGQNEVAKEMDDLMKDFSKMLQRGYLPRATNTPRCFISIIDHNIMKLIIFPMLGFGRKAVLCRASITKYPWFPRKPPVGWGTVAPLAEGGDPEDGAGAAEAADDGMD